MSHGGGHRSHRPHGGGGQLGMLGTAFVAAIFIASHLNAEAFVFMLGLGAVVVAAAASDRRPP